MAANDCRTPREKTLFKLCMFISSIFWLVLIVTVVGLIYGLFIGFFLMVIHALFIAHVRGHAVKLSSEQLPDLYAKVVDACEKLGLKKIPDAYVMQAGGMLNAFATKFIGRNYVLIYSDLIEACGDDDKAVDMIVGHEVGHLALGHLKWLMYLAPARMMPWLGSAYSRACEYSCDRCGLEVVGDLNVASRGLVVLAAGGKLAPKVSLKTFVNQMNENTGFWGTIYELNATHPYLPKRIAALVNSKQPNAIRIPGRSKLAYPVAPFFSFASGGAGAASGALMIVAMIGILSAIAIPQFKQYQARAQMMQMQGALDQGEAILQQGLIQAQSYQASNGAYPCSDTELGLPEVAAFAAEMGWEYELNCEANYLAFFYAQDGETHYKAAIFDSGEIKEGILQD